MKRYIGWVMALLLALTACSAVQDSDSQNEASPSTDSLTTPDQLLDKPWEEIEALAKGTTVNIFMWGGDEGINQYMDEWVAPRLKEKKGIELIRHPMDTPDFMQKLLTEKKANQTQGTMDIIWINGENFRNAKENDLLWGPFLSHLPSAQHYLDFAGTKWQYDFGTPVEDLEAPWGKVQFVFLYDAQYLQKPPATWAELKEWIKNNPGRFTYPNPSDFTGNAFLRHLLYESVGGVDVLLEKGYDPAFAEKASTAMWEDLRAIKPYLWRQGETYPESLTQLDHLYSQGEVWLTMGYNEARAESLIQNGTFPETTRSFIFETGAIGNYHFLSIPFNTPNPAGALVTINFLLTPEAQLAKLDPSMWGENMSLDVTKLSEEDQKAVSELERGESVLPASVLEKAFLPEVDAQYVEWIKEQWKREVLHH